MWYRFVPKTGYLYVFDIFTGRIEATDLGSGESIVLQLTEKLIGSFCCIFFDNILTSSLLLRKLAENFLYGIGVVQQN